MYSLETCTKVALNAAIVYRIRRRISLTFKTYANETWIIRLLFDKNRDSSYAIERILAFSLRKKKEKSVSFALRNSSGVKGDPSYFSFIYIYPTKFQVTANFYSIKEFKETWTNGSIFKILELDNRNSFPRNGGSRKEKEEDGIDETFVKVREFF